MDRAPEPLRNKLGIAIAKRVYGAYRSVLSSHRWQRVYNFGARPQRLLCASTGTKDPKAPDTLYVNAPGAPFTISTMPDKMLKAVADQGDVRAPMSETDSESERVLKQFAECGIDINALATRLQDEGAKSFVESWRDLMNVISSNCIEIEKAS